MDPKRRIDRDEVLLALRPAAVIERFEMKGRRSGAEFRTRHCPTCGPRARDSVAINLETGRWIDHAHGCKGDVLDLLAGLADINPSIHFGRLLELAADIAGITPTDFDPEMRARRRAELARRHQEVQAEEARADAARRTDAISRATARWDALDHRSKAGEAYLERRGVAGVLELGLVRFAPDAVAIALRTADGQIVNVVRRRLSAGDPKVLGMKGCPTAGTFIDSVADIAHGRSVVLVEGVFDAFTARLAWPSAVILGAHGAGNVAKIAAAAMPRIKLSLARLFLVPHADDAGESSMIAAGRIALGAGLRYELSVRVVDCQAKDLNDGWCAGWRPAP